MSGSENALIQEEQKIVDKLIKDMDAAILDMDARMNYHSLQVKKARESCLPDTYGMLIAAENDATNTRNKRNMFKSGRDELYQTRIVVNYDGDDGKGREELKIGLHTYSKAGTIFIISWKMPVCRHYILDNSAEEYDEIVEDQRGRRYYTHYELELKRQVDLFFDTVQNVTHLYPILDEETEKIIADEFLQELLKRRSEKEFKNIVFSIQKKQGEIIQTPYGQNLIVQGCAGSGKSMIMLHRLPILLYDNQTTLDRNNMYIITPSTAYIQLVNNLCIDLEIDDVRKGTLAQYYESQIRKYGKSPDIYGMINPTIQLSEKDLKYVYSEACIQSIREQIHELADKVSIDYAFGYSCLGMRKQVNVNRAVNLKQDIEQQKDRIRELLERNAVVLRRYLNDINDVISQVNVFCNGLKNRKKDLVAEIQKSLSSKRMIINSLKRDLSKIDREVREIMYQNRLKELENALAAEKDDRETLEIIELDQEYFDGLSFVADQVRNSIDQFIEKYELSQRDTIENRYRLIGDIHVLGRFLHQILDGFKRLEDPYRDYMKSFLNQISGIETLVFQLEQKGDRYLPQEYCQQLFDARDYFNEVGDKSLKNIYLNIMKRLDVEMNLNGRMEALTCSPYIYLQILYQFAGAPNGKKDSLITIDEAQNIAKVELSLIKALNSNHVIFNLFGDVKQHVEGSKGIDSWKEIQDISSFKLEYMQENYRNARQITNFCNRKFNLNMRAINMDGTGVHEIKSEDAFADAFFGIFQKPKNEGLSCIIVKNQMEADQILTMAGMYSDRIQNQTMGYTEIKNDKWNMITAEQSKGLEFQTVFVLSGRMSENEKYIAYTRALDELYVYEGILSIPEIEDSLHTEEKDKEQSKKDTVDTEEKVQETSSRKRRRKKEAVGNTKVVKKAGSLKEFFETYGFEVIDDRMKSGHLWVIGDKDKLEPIVDKAMEKFGAIGSFGSGKVSGFRNGWFTKSKK